MNKSKFIMAALAGAVAVSVASAPVFAADTAKPVEKKEIKKAEKTTATEKKEKHACNGKEGCKSKESCKGKEGCKSKESCKSKDAAAKKGAEKKATK